MTIADAIRQDLRYAVSSMRNMPVFTVIAIGTLALAIGANTAMFTVIRAVLFRPLQYPNAESLVRLPNGATPTRFFEMRAAARSFDGLTAYTAAEDLTLEGTTEPEVVLGVHVSANFLSVLRVQPLIGRSFRTDEDQPGAAGVAMISAGLWQRHFGGDPRIAGKTVVFSDAPYTVIGVLPYGFGFPSHQIDVWMTAPTELSSFPAASRRLSPYLTVIGRLKSGVTLEQANAELRVIRSQYAAAHPPMLDAKPKSPVELESMKDSLVADVRSMLWMLLGAVGLVLLIACANVAGLLLARAGARSREFALRAALGATRRRLIGQLLAESILLALCGGGLGLLLAAALVRAIPRLTLLELPRVSEIHIDPLVACFAAALSILTGILFGLAPSFASARLDLIQLLRAGGEAATRSAPAGFFRGLTFRGLLSAAQIALSMVLVIGASLLTASIAHLRGVDLGFNPSHLLTMRVSLPLTRYSTDQKKAAFFDELIERAKAIPGVRGAAAALTLPMEAFPGIPVQDAAKPPRPLNERLIAKFFAVSPDYFRTLGIPLRRGRTFTDQDVKASQRVAVIDENLARHFWPAYPAGQNPIGQRLFVGGVNPKPAEIVGIVANAHQTVEPAIWPESVYVALAQNPFASTALAFRTAGDPLSFTEAIRDQVRAIDRNQPVTQVRTMEQRVDEEVGQRRLLMLALASFAGMAVLLAVMGIYGVIAYSVAQRTQEMGIRRALGAQQSDILWLVVGQGLVLAGLGIAAGTAAALALTRVLGSLLFQVSARDPAIFAAAAVALFVAALAASYIPARRATRVDPMSALRA